MTQLRLRRDAIWRDADGEVLALDGELRSYFSTNATGSLLWKALADGASREELVELLMTRFGLEADHAERDVDAFVGELAANGFLEA
jgi:hypothetical protein